MDHKYQSGVMSLGWIQEVKRQEPSTEADIVESDHVASLFQRVEE